MAKKALLSAASAINFSAAKLSSSEFIVMTRLIGNCFAVAMVSPH